MKDIVFKISKLNSEYCLDRLLDVENSEVTEQRYIVLHII